MNKHPNLKVGDYVTWDHGGRAQCAAIESFLTNGRGVLVQVAERTFEMLYWDEIDTLVEGDMPCPACGSYPGDGHAESCVSGAEYERTYGAPDWNK